MLLKYYANIYSFPFQLSSDVSGRHAQTKIRGRMKDKAEEEQLTQDRIQADRKEMEVKYSRWNKG